MITTPSLADLSAEQLRRALAIKEQIAALESELAELAGSGGDGPSYVPSVAGARRKARRISAAGRARIIAAQKRRWAAVHGRSASAAAPARGKSKRRRISAAGRANIAAAARARWARYRAMKGA